MLPILLARPPRHWEKFSKDTQAHPQRTITTFFSPSLLLMLQANQSYTTGPAKGLKQITQAICRAPIGKGFVDHNLSTLVIDILRQADMHTSLQKTIYRLCHQGVELKERYVYQCTGFYKMRGRYQYLFNQGFGPLCKVMGYQDKHCLTPYTSSETKNNHNFLLPHHPCSSNQSIKGYTEGLTNIL